MFVSSGRFRGAVADGGSPTLQDSFVDVLNAVGDTFEVRALGANYDLCDVFFSTPGCLVLIVPEINDVGLLEWLFTLLKWTVKII